MLWIKFIPLKLQIQNILKSNLSRSSTSNSTGRKSINLDSRRESLNLITDDFEFISESHFYSEKFQHNLIEIFLKQLYSEKEIEVDSMAKIMDILYNNSSFSKTFIDFILKDRKNLFIYFGNFNNLQHFANILNSISLNLENCHSENFELNFAIIFIAERTFYVDLKKNAKTYLCAVLSKNKLFATRSFWIELIELKLSRRIQEQLSRFDKNESYPGFSKNEFLSGNSRNEFQQDSNKNLFSNIGSKLKNIFNNRDNPLVNNLSLKSTSILNTNARTNLVSPSNKFSYKNCDS